MLRAGQSSWPVPETTLKDVINPRSSSPKDDFTLKQLAIMDGIPSPNELKSHLRLLPLARSDTTLEVHLQIQYTALVKNACCVSNVHVYDMHCRTPSCAQLAYGVHKSFVPGKR